MAERRELLGLADPKSGDEMRQDFGGGFGIVEGIVGSVEADTEALAEIVKAMRMLTLGVESPRHLQRAQDLVDS